jgi:hypothetical protein
MSVGSSVSSVAVISSSSLVRFSVLQPWMNPPPRTGISRESGSVRLRTGPGPFRFSSRSAALACAACSRSRAFSTWAAASLTRQCALAGRRGGFRSGRPVSASDAALRASH